MAKVKCTTTTGTFEVLESGNFVLLQSATDFAIEVSDLTFKFFLQSDETAADVAQVRQLGAEGKTLNLAMVNWNYALGTAWQSEVGHFGGRPLLLSLFMTLVGEGIGSQRVFQYSFFLKEV